MTDRLTTHYAKPVPRDQNVALCSGKWDHVWADWKVVTCEKCLKHRQAFEEAIAAWNWDSQGVSIGETHFRFLIANNLIEYTGKGGVYRTARGEDRRPGMVQHESRLQDAVNESRGT